jgi:hypothetical protein
MAERPVSVDGIVRKQACQPALHFVLRDLAQQSEVSLAHQVLLEQTQCRLVPF